MPGFSYGGGVGDGTSWSSEHGSGPAPGGGSNGNAGNHDSGSSVSGTATQRQYSAIRNDQAFMQKLTDLVKAAVRINPAAKLQISSISVSGSMSITVTGLTSDQGKAIGLGGLVMGFSADGVAYAVGNIETGHRRSGSQTSSGGSNGSGVNYGMSAAQLKASSLGLFLAALQATEAANAAAAAAEAKRKADEEAQRQQAAWDAQHVEEAAQRHVNEAQQRIDQAARNKAAAEQRASGHDAAANNIQNEQNALRQKQQQLYDEFQRFVKGGALSVVGSARWRTAMQLKKQSDADGAAADAKQNDINREHSAAEQARNEASQYQQQIGQYQREKAEAENRLNAIRQESQAKAKAEADARTAAENKAKADAAAKAKAAADAAAEKVKAMQAREAAAARLSSPGIQSVRGIPASASMAGSPLSWAVAGVGGMTLGDDIAVAFRAFINAAVAELNGIATVSRLGPMAIAIGALFYSKEAGTGSDLVPGRDISAVLQGDILSLPAAAVLERAAETKTSVSMPVRGRMVVRDDGTFETQLVRDTAAGSVPVVRAVLDTQTGYWGYTLPMMPGVPPQTILVSPADAPGVNGPLGLTGPVPLPEHILHTGDQVTAPQGVTVTTTPVADDLDFADVILIFPAVSGLKPLYIMLRSPRNMPGTASGKGHPVGGNWLGNAGVGEGAPIPSQIADKLRGKTFGSFDSFRRAFWKAVADDPELSKQFDSNSLDTMKNGRAPYVRKQERVGKRVKVELHHKQEISKGGDVYNVDNLNALTPKRHIDIHRGN